MEQGANCNSRDGVGEFSPGGPVKAVFHIGALRLCPPTVMAPMAGVTDTPFRSLVKQTGCGLVCSEMISANGLCQGTQKTLDMLKHRESEKPLSLQIFGAKPQNMARAAKIARQAGADIIDINFGCSVKKIIKTGAGVALMKDRQRARDVIAAVRDAVPVPVTIKIRSGWDASGLDALELAEMAQDLGVDAVVVHPRTARQKFSGTADWGVIAAVKRALSIPVIGNGDIWRPQDALEMLGRTGCDAVMIGRAAVGNPWIFSQVRDLMAGRPIAEPDLETRFSAIRGYVADMVACYGETHGCRIMRSRLGWLLKGLPEAGRFRRAVTGISTPADAGALLRDYQQRLCRLSSKPRIPRTQR